MARLRGWAPKGERCRAAIPHGHWKTVTFVSGLTLAGFVAPMLLDGPMDGECFLAWVEQMLVPTLRSGDIVIMDNLAAHKVAGVRQSSRKNFVLMEQVSLMRGIPITHSIAMSRAISLRAVLKFATDCSILANRPLL
ncbi:hypothetical protein V1282_003868 [Nitrobacteraceae bacterium AZCC 2146]